MEECLQTLKRLSKEYSYRNIYQIMADYGGKVAAEYSKDEKIQSITYGEYDKKIRRAAWTLAQANLEKGHIGIKLENSPEWPVFVWAALMAGWSPVLLDVKGEKKTTAHLLKQANARALITEESSEGYQGVTVFRPKELLGQEAAPEDYQPTWADEICLTTSGTTGTAKVYSYNGYAMGNQMANAKDIITRAGDIMYDETEGPCKNLAFLPLHHIFGFVAVYMWYSFFGKTIVYLADRNPKTIMETCRRHEVTHIYCVPMFWNNVAQGVIRKAKQGGQEKMFSRMANISMAMQKRMKNKGRKMVANSVFKSVQANLVGSSIRYLISGGGHILPETLQIINAIGYPLYNGFGMTEAGITSVECSSDVEVRLQGSVGIPFESVEYKVTGEDGTGELLIRGSSLHTGQWIDGVFHPRNQEDWFSTGDIARLENGKLFLEGRAKEVIVNQSGENIYPDELEDYFINLPGVKNLCVTGLNTGGAYEDIVIVLELEAGLEAKEIAALAEAIDEINRALPMGKKLAKVLVSPKPLPVANGIKVQRQKLRKKIEKGEWDVLNLDLTLKVLESPEKKNVDRSQDFDQEFLEIRDQVRKIFAEVLILDESEIGDFDHFVTDLGGDSLSVIGVIAQLEEKYNLFIPDAEFQRAVNVHEIAELLYNKLHGIEAQEDASENFKGARITDFTKTKEYAELEQRFQETVENGANPYFVAHDSTVRDTSVVAGKQVINLGSYNYLGLSGHPETVQAAVEAARKYGTSASGSRVLAGEKTLYQELEQAIARWKHTEDAIVLTGGYATNLTFIGNFCGEGDLILYDALSHNSIVQGCQLSQAQSKAFPHNDIAALESMLKNVEEEFTKVLLVVEGVYSMDGDIAPIPEFVRLKKQYGAFLMVDEAHSSGVIGDHGGGVDDYFGLDPKDVDIKMGTLSKALGTCGGYIAASKPIIDYLKYSLPGFVFTAGMSPPLAAACKRGIEILQAHPELVEKLHQNIQYFIEGAKKRRFNTIYAKESAIVPVWIGDDATAFQVSDALLKKGVFVPPAVFPAVAKGQSRLRFSLSSAHSTVQLEEALNKLEEVAKEYGII